MLYVKDWNRTTCASRTTYTRLSRGVTPLSCTHIGSSSTDDTHPQSPQPLSPTLWMRATFYISPERDSPDPRKTWEIARCSSRGEDNPHGCPDITGLLPLSPVSHPSCSAQGNQREVILLSQTQVLPAVLARELKYS